MAGIITAKLHFARPGAQLRGVISGARGWIKLIMLPTQMKYGGCSSLITIARVPIARYSAADPDCSPQHIGMGECETIVQRTRLGKAEQENSPGIRDAVGSQ